jgi:hypothetical protein
MVAPGGKQLAKPVQRVIVFRPNIQNPAVATFRLGSLSLLVKGGRLRQGVGNAPRVDPAAEVPAVPGLHNGAMDPALRTTVGILVGLVAAQKIVFRKAVFDRVTSRTENCASA